MKAFSDTHVCEVIAKIDGVRHGTQRLDSVFFHPFPARMSLAVAELIIERLSRPAATVLDPMVGSGTTLIAAKKLGRSGFGFDLDPLAVKLARVNTLTLDRSALQEVHDRVWARAVECSQTQCHLSVQTMWSSEEDKAFINFWFPKRSQTELTVLAAAIQDEHNAAVQDFLWSVFSSLIVAKSASVSYASDLAHSRPHRDLNKQVLSPLEVWPSRFERALKQLAFPLGSEPYGEAEVGLGDARRFNVQATTVDLVLTSPPYLSASRDCRQAIDYMRTHKFSLVWMGHRLASLRQLRSTMIETEVGLPSPNGLPEPFEQRLSQLIPRSPARRRIRKYLSDLHTVLAEIHRVLRPGAVDATRDDGTPGPGVRGVQGAGRAASGDAF